MEQTLFSTLTIKNFAIISELELDFENGLNIITGETGAGKSILISALNLLTGDKASEEIIRTGETYAMVEARWFLSDNDAKRLEKIFENLGIEIEDDNALTIRRIVSSVPRKSKAYVGNTIQPLSVLKNIMHELLDISGQHEHVGLLNQNKHIAILDNYARLSERLDDYRITYRHYKNLVEQEKKLENQQAERNRKLDFLEFQIQELTQADIKIGEIAELEKESKKLANAENTAQCIQNAVQILHENDQSLLFLLAGVKDQMKKLDIDDLDNVTAQLEQAYYSLEDVARFLTRYNAVEADPERLEDIQQRLNFLDKIKRKYAADEQGLLRTLKDFQKEFDELSSQQGILRNLKPEIDKAHRICCDKAIEISKIRRKNAQKMQQSVTEELHALSMENAAFYVNVASDINRLDADGCDNVSFALLSNLGGEPKALAKIASGGELSRVLLAIKRVSSENDDTACYVFDEVDTGIGGNTAAKVAVALKDVSLRRQVICITHLPVVASFADTHFYVHKKVVDQMTHSAIVRLENNDVIAELARLSGTALTPAAEEHAREMLRHASEISARLASEISSV